MGARTCSIEGTGLGGGHDEREQTLNHLLAEMDGFEAAEGIVVLAATNRPDILDPALLRAGRFDRQVVIPLPTLDERLAILQVHCQGKRMAAGTRLDTIARGTPGMSGADLENLVNEAALIAVRRGSQEITDADLEAARDRVLLGLKRTSLVLSAEEKRIVAYHEAGHAVLAQLLPHADPVQRNPGRHPSQRDHRRHRATGPGCSALGNATRNGVGGEASQGRRAGPQPPSRKRLWLTHIT